MRLDRELSYSCKINSLSSSNRALFVFQKGTFCIAKGALLRCKRASFTHQKGTFYNAKEHLLFFSIRIYITLCPDGPILVLYVC